MVAVAAFTWASRPVRSGSLPLSCKRAVMSSRSRSLAPGIDSCAFLSASARLGLPQRSRARLRPHQAMAQFGSWRVAVSNERAASIHT